MAKILIIMLFLTCVSMVSRAQEAVPVRLSPLAVATAKYKDTYLKITYSQPQKRGREIFGKLVPYGQVWRAGANEATEITITKDILFNNILLRAGTYSVFTIPEKNTWTIIINSELGLWGSYNYNQRLDVFRFEVPVSTTEKVTESFTIVIDQRNEVADLTLLWDITKLSIPIKFIN